MQLKLELTILLLNRRVFISLVMGSVKEGIARFGTLVKKSQEKVLQYKK